MAASQAQRLQGKQAAIDAWGLGLAGSVVGQLATPAARLGACILSGCRSLEVDMQQGASRSQHCSQPLGCSRTQVSWRCWSSSMRQCCVPLWEGMHTGGL